MTEKCERVTMRGADQPLSRGATRRCSVCCEEKALSEFAKRGKDRLRAACKSCINARRRKRYAAVRDPSARVREAYPKEGAVKCRTCGSSFAPTDSQRVSRSRKCGPCVSAGHRAKATYWIWNGIVQRCTNPKAANYQYYGAKGITVCDAWRTYTNFTADMGPRPSTDHSVDRIDNSRGYEPGNCRWATALQQQRNKTSNLLVTVGGEIKCLEEWAETLRVDPGTITHRIKRGWSPEQAVTTPKRPFEKLAESQVLEIRRRVAAGERREPISRDYGIDVKSVSNIMTGRTYSHIKGSNSDAR